MDKLTKVSIVVAVAMLCIFSLGVLFTPQQAQATKTPKQAQDPACPTGEHYCPETYYGCYPDGTQCPSVD
jgi:hypothetical protein